MFNKYFGNYLLAKKHLTNDQLREVLAQQEKVRVKLGILAIDAGIMDAIQVTEIHGLQETKDKRFGELAIEKGYMTEDDLDKLLTHQRESHVTLGQLLVDKNILDLKGYEKLLSQYKKDSGYSDQEIEILKSNDTDLILELIIKHHKHGNMELYKEYIELFIRNIVRFVDSDLFFDAPVIVNSHDYKHFATQEITGAHNILTGIDADEKVFLEFASRYANMTIPILAALAKDSIGEFMNCQNGLFISNLYHRGVNCDLEAQDYMDHASLEKGEQLIVLPCELSFGKINIVFNIKGA